MNNKKIITENEKGVTIKNMSFDSFCSWINTRIKNDWKYSKTSNFYNLLILFEKSIVEQKSENLDVLQLLKPIYPWKKEWLEFFEESLTREKILIKRIEDLEEILKNKNDPDI